MLFSRANKGVVGFGDYVFPLLGGAFPALPVEKAKNKRLNSYFSIKEQSNDEKTPTLLYSGMFVTGFRPERLCFGYHGTVRSSDPLSRQL
jgi:hypothetical protein